MAENGVEIPDDIPAAAAVNAASVSTAVLQRCFPQNELQGRRIRLYRNGDRYFKVCWGKIIIHRTKPVQGIWYTIIPSLRSWSAFLEDIQKIHFFIGSISLPQGVRFVFHVSGELCRGLEEIQHGTYALGQTIPNSPIPHNTGQTYVVSSTDKFKRIDYANASQPMWSFVSNKMSEPPIYGLRETFIRVNNIYIAEKILTV